MILLEAHNIKDEVLIIFLGVYHFPCCELRSMNKISS